MAKEDSKLINKIETEMAARYDFQHKDDIDLELLELLATTHIPLPAETESRVRRTLGAFVIPFWASALKQGREENCQVKDIILGAMTEALLVGIVLGSSGKFPMEKVLKKS